MNSFLPNNYSVPNPKSNYMKFVAGINRFRILANPIIGFEYWQEDSKGGKTPIRVHTEDEINMDSVQDPNSIKHFWAMPVWNYNEERIQILEITQKGIQKSIMALSSDTDWGSPINFDIVVTKTGEKLETKYEVQPKPAKPIDAEIKEKFEKISIRLEALYDGADPFKSDELPKVEANGKKK